MYVCSVRVDLISLVGCGVKQAHGTRKRVPWAGPEIPLGVSGPACLASNVDITGAVSTSPSQARVELADPKGWLG